MKRFITVTAALLGTAVAGVLVWRKVESDQIRNDLWAEAEKVSAEQDALAEKQPEPVPAARA